MPKLETTMYTGTEFSKEHIPYMNRALELAKLGEKTVAPNPMVGCVIVKGGEIVGEGYHQLAGEPHAEIFALQKAGESARGATVYITLEPCSHQGRTPPCTEALIEAKVGQVVLAMRDPNPKVNGTGLRKLREAGIRVVEHVLENEARDLNARYLMRVEKRRPWIVAKWAMTLDGKIATRTGSSQWISSESSRSLTHNLRGEMDAILIGSRTAQLDDPSLTVRVFKENARENPVKRFQPQMVPSRRITDPTGPRTPLRVILDSNASLSPDSRLVQTAREIPVLIGIASDAPLEKVETLRRAGCEVMVLPGRISMEAPELKRSRDFRPGSATDRVQNQGKTFGEPTVSEQKWARFRVYRERFEYLFENLAHREITTLLVEGGGLVMGSLFDARMIDEVHVFIAPKLIGGEKAAAAIAGIGLPEMVDALQLKNPVCKFLWPDIYVHGRIAYPVS